MEILHIVSKETNGTFRVAYFDGFGQLNRVLKGPERATRSFAPGLGDLSFLGSGNFSDGQKQNDVLDYVTLGGSPFQLREKGKTFEDIKVDRPVYAPSKMSRASSLFPVMANRDQLDFEGLFGFSKGLDITQKDEGIGEVQMNEIRRMFSKLYMDKARKEHKRKSHKILKTKVYKFKHSGSSDSDSSSSDGNSLLNEGPKAIRRSPPIVSATSVRPRSNRSLQ